ncbi:MAG: Gfo/Idh/MocA family oxidoreductase [Clostridia bacterium]|nr:Gfo/Idh/MocA family oxidoreductase [Clostridia bacterium]
MKHVMAVIGYGGMGSWHCKNVRERLSDRFEIAGIYDISEERCKVAEQDGLHAYSSLEELLADERIELVTVATPNNSHKSISIAAMRAGKNVISEKPVMMNTAELLEVIEVANETGKLFTVHQNRRWDKDYLTVKNAVNNNLLGDVFMIESRVHGGRRVLHGWRGYKEDGGGMLLDWGIHLLDQLLQLIDSPVVSVHAEAQYIYTKEVDDNIRMHLAFENGIKALIEVMTCSFVRMPRWQVYGELGTLRIDDWNCEGKLVQVRTDVEPEWSESIVYTEGGPTRTMAPLPVDAVKETPLEIVSGDWSEYYSGVADALEGIAPPPVSHEQMVRDMKVVDATFESIEKGCSIACRI